MSVSDTPDERGRAGYRGIRRQRTVRVVGAMEAPPVRKPVVGVGRHAARCYCPTCGQKRAACRCEASA